MNIVVKSSLFVVALCMLSMIESAQAQVALDMCPTGFSQGVVTTGTVECTDESSRRSERQDAEIDRLELEAICNSVANAEVSSSLVLGTSSGGFFSQVTCTISRPTPPGTTFCPAGSEEVYRAFDTLVCGFFGSAADTMAEAQTELAAQTSACATGATGQVLSSGIEMGTVLDDVPFFYSTLTCRLPTVATNVLECPYGFHELDRDEDEIECNLDGRDYETLAEADQANSTAQSLCVATTAGLGSVTFTGTGITSSGTFFSTVDCLVAIPRYSEYADQGDVRACDATCTEDVQQARVCLNGGQIGGPGCLDSSTQVITRKCNTGTLSSSACPLIITPTIVPTLLLNDDE